MALVWSSPSNDDEYERTIRLELRLARLQPCLLWAWLLGTCIEWINARANDASFTATVHPHEATMAAGQEPAAEPEPITALKAASDTWQTSREQWRTAG
jgi:hypothetical protein